VAACAGVQSVEKHLAILGSHLAILGSPALPRALNLLKDSVNTECKTIKKY
jgi:hypothetical protein